MKLFTDISVNHNTSVMIQFSVHRPSNSIRLGSLLLSMKAEDISDGS